MIISSGEVLLSVNYNNLPVPQTYHHYVTSLFGQITKDNLPLTTECAAPFDIMGENYKLSLQKIPQSNKTLDTFVWYIDHTSVP